MRKRILDKIDQAVKVDGRVYVVDVKSVYPESGYMHGVCRIRNVRYSVQRPMYDGQVWEVK